MPIAPIFKMTFEIDECTHSAAIERMAEILNFMAKRRDYVGHSATGVSGQIKGVDGSTVESDMPQAEFQNQHTKAQQTSLPTEESLTQAEAPKEPKTRKPRAVKVVEPVEATKETEALAEQQPLDMASSLGEETDAVDEDELMAMLGTKEEETPEETHSVEDYKSWDHDKLVGDAKRRITIKGAPWFRAQLSSLNLPGFSAATDDNLRTMFMAFDQNPNPPA